MRWLWFVLLSITSVASAQNRVFFAGAAERERFNDVHRLSDGTYLIAGQAQNLNWLAPSLPRIALTATGIDSTSAGNVGFVLHVSADLATPLRVVHFPNGTVRDVFKIRTTEVPGSPTGNVFISGSRDGSTNDGYYLARLNGNFVSAPPSGVAMIFNVRASGDHKDRQPWDVDGQGNVFYATGRGFDTNWAAIETIDASGGRRVIEHWHAHWHGSEGNFSEWDGTPASSYPNAASAPLRYSAVVMKVNRRGSLRSINAADYALLGSDANGNAGRQGKFPDDYYHTGACALAGTNTCPNTGPGYTGYRANSARTQRVGAITLDRRNGDLYFGYSTQSVLPGGNPDFEPAVVAMTANGQLRWWDRLYQETSANSSPDQYVDGLAIDHGQNRLIVLARTHGNNTINFWRGNALAASSGSNGFQNQFTGTNGNIHISWLGSFRLNDGRVLAATYLAEFVEGGNNYGAAHPDPLLGGWPNPNAGWPDVNTTRCGADAGFSGEIAIATDGAVGVLCKGRRTITTTDAFQLMPRPNQSNPPAGAWNQFVRVYTPDLSGLRYSSLIVGAWDTSTGAGGDNTRLSGIAFSPDAVVTVGSNLVDAANLPLGNAVPTTNVPTWGSSSAAGESGLVARLTGARLAPSGENLFANGFE